jgi:putative acetyltransferase
LIRPYKTGDHIALADVFKRSVLELGRQDYSAEQAEVWAKRGSDPDRWKRICSDGRVTYVAELDGVVSGFINLEADGHIDHFFILSDARGQGVAQALFDALIAYADKAEMARIYVEASEAARRFFLRQEFDCLERHDLELDGVAIHNYAMEKKLG